MTTRLVFESSTPLAIEARTSRLVAMPTVLRIDGYRFFFYSNENDEPPHIHVEKGDATAKWWLDPVALARNAGFKPAQRRHIRTIIVEHRTELMEAWDAHFNG